MDRKFPQTTSLPALLESGNDRAFRAVAEAVWRSAQRVSAINSRLAAEAGISPAQYSIIMTLAYSENGISVGSLAERLALSQPFVTMEVGKLARAKMIIKRANPDDKRSVLVSLSKEGRAAVRWLANMLQKSNDILFKNLTTEDFRYLKKLIGDISLQSELALNHIESHLKLAAMKRRNPIDAL